MTITPTALLSLPIITTGTESGTWGDVVDNGLTSYLDIAIAGGLAISITGTGTVVTLANTAGTSASTGITSTTAQYAILNISGAKTGACTLNLPVTSKWYIIHNAGTGGFALTVRGVTPTTGVTLVDGEECIVAWNGTDYVKVASSVLTALTGVLPLANGGTNAISAPAAMASLMGFTTTATAAGTTALDNTSSFYQQFTGTTTQAITLPLASTLVTGWTFHIVNNSTGNLTVNAATGINPVITVLPGTTAMCTCILASGTTATSWEAGLTDFSTATGTGAVVLGTTPTLNTPALAGETFSTAATVTAGTNAQGQGALTNDYNVVTTAAANPSGVTLPSATVGRRVIVVNKGINPVNVYPAASDIIDALLVNISIPLPVGGAMEFNASSVSQWYSTYNLYTTSDGYATTVTAAGSTALTSTSGYKQYFTGTTIQTVTLPVVTTLALGRSYEIVNNSTGVLTVNSSGAAFISTIPAGMSAVVTCIAITGTGVGSWHFEYTSYDAITGTGASVFAVSPTITGNDTTIEGLAIGLGNGAVATNTAYGVNALNANTTGDYNTAIGNGTLQVNSIGAYNTAVGAFALSEATGGNSTAVGAGTLQTATTGADNTAIGYFALANLVTGNQNVGVGADTLGNLSLGDSNTAVGAGAMAIGDGSLNVAVGCLALTANTAAELVAVGANALTANTTGAEGAAVGFNALTANTTGARNTALGYKTLTAITTAGDSTALGAYALTAATGGNNTAVGSASLSNTVGGLNNTAVGAYALAANISGNSNTAIGNSAGGSITTGSNNVVIGSYMGATAPISTTGSSWIVLSDGQGNVRGAFDSLSNFLVGTTSAATPATASSLSVANTFGFKNRIINGAFNVGQYTGGSAGIGTGNASVYVTDRWLGQGSGASCAITSAVASTTLPTSSVPQNALTVTANNASNVALAVAQRIEAINVADLHNQTVAVQAYVATSNSATVTWTAYYANTANTWQATGLTSGITVGATSIATGTFSTTASLALKTFTFALGTNAATKGLMIVFSCTSTATSSITLTGVQLEKGAAATSFDYRPYTTELTLASRYYGQYGTVVGTSTFTNPIVPRTAMRVTPTVSAVSVPSGTGAAYSFSTYGAATGFGVAYQSTAHSATAQALFTLNSEL